jgi:hypothetical protein
MSPATVILRFFMGLYKLLYERGAHPSNKMTPEHSFDLFSIKMLTTYFSLSHMQPDNILMHNSTYCRKVTESLLNYITVCDNISDMLTIKKLQNYA